MDLIAEQFRDAVSRNPEALAIVDGHTELTYRQLASSAEHITRALSAIETTLDARTPRLIAIMMSHSADAVTVIIGAVLAGWAYTPLDVDAEPDVLTDMLTRCGSEIVVADSANMARAQEVSNRRHRVLDAKSLLQMHEPATPSTRQTEAADDALAYILYTSGSVGPSKPAHHSRRSLLRSIRCYREDCALDPTDRVSLITPLWFTPSVICIFGTLLSGATLCILDSRRNDAPVIAEWARAQRLTLLYTTPTIFRRWANMLPNVNPESAPASSLRMIQLAGEPLLASDVGLFQGKFAEGVQLYNGMGTAETSCAARFFIDHTMTFTDGSVPIGYPYDDVDLVLRNPNGRIVGAGEVGNLFIRLNQMADEELDTGDLVMREAGGRLVHFGRRGERAMIDGVGVDLLEIESLLMSRSDVCEAAVFVDSGEADPRLTAAVTFTKGARTEADDLAQALGGILPQQMIPTSWIVSDSLPILGTGKLDRAALGLLSPRKIVRTQVRVPSSDTLDDDLLEVFRSILSKPDLAANEDFFNGGGTVGMALDLTMEIERKFGAGLSVSLLRRAPTAINLAHALRRQSFDGHVDRTLEGLLGTVWQLDHSPPLEIGPVELPALPAAAQTLLGHDQSMTATLQAWSGSSVTLNVLAQRQAGRYFMRKIELEGGGDTLAIAGIRIDLAAFAPSVRLEILAGDIPFGTILQRYGIETQHRLQGLFETSIGAEKTFGRTNRIEDTTGAPLADVVEVLAITL